MQDKRPHFLREAEVARTLAETIRKEAPWTGLPLLFRLRARKIDGKRGGRGIKGGGGMKQAVPRQNPKGRPQKKAAPSRL